MANLLLGVTGSVAAMKTPSVVAALRGAGHAVTVVATEPALYFFDAAELPAGMLVRDADEWPAEGYNRGDPVKHIELRRWADLLVVAPLDANTLAKFALGLADNCLTCVWRARDRARPVVLAPAMNTLMWCQPVTARHLRQIARDAGMNVAESNDPDEVCGAIAAQAGPLVVVAPVAKELACGDVGVGAMAEPPAIAAHVLQALTRVPPNP